MRLFHSVVAVGQVVERLPANGSRLYIDVGAHPEYATAECDSIEDLIALDKAGERIVAAPGRRRASAARRRGRRRPDPPVQEQHRLRGQLLRLPRELPGAPPLRLRRHSPSQLLPFLVSGRSSLAPVASRAPAARPSYCFSPRADHMWEAMSARRPRRSRPMINTRDEPHAHADLYRRMHVIVGDSYHCRADRAAQGRAPRTSSCACSRRASDARARARARDAGDPRHLARPPGAATRRTRGRQAG